jgi:anaerobic magnesium-protoporphyrin IX monomethyl ester cyclase
LCFQAAGFFAFCSGCWHGVYERGRIMPIKKDGRKCGDSIRFALVSPPAESLTQAPPIHLGYLAAVLANARVEAGIFDFKLLDAPFLKIVENIIEWSPKYIGISCKTVEMPGAVELCGIFRRRLPCATIVLGGVHATALPEKTLLESGADYVVAGEGEGTVAELVAAVESHSTPAGVDGLFYNLDGKAVGTRTGEFIKNLDEIPFPAWEMIPPARYSEFTSQLYKRRPVVASIITSRGCPFHCAFCANCVHGRKIRLRSPANVADEIEYLIEKFSVGEFHIIDDNFAASRNHAAGFCEEILQRRLDIVWKFPPGIRADSVDEELVALFKRAGCYEVGFGIESGNQKVLDGLNKQQDLSKIKDKINLFHKYGIGVYGFFILGLPGDNRESVKDTIRFMKKGFDHVSISFCIPYPGSEIFSETLLRGDAVTDWGRYAHHNIFPGVSELSPGDLRKYMRIAILSFYLRPRRMLSLIGKLRSVPLKYTLRLVKRYFGIEDKVKTCNGGNDE